MKQLKAKLYELEMHKRRESQRAVEDDKADIGWGSQIRSYVLDQSRIKDLRTGVEIGNIGRCSTATSTASSRQASRRGCEVGAATERTRRRRCSAAGERHRDVAPAAPPIPWRADR